ncbi:MAG: hypothetical protein IKL78_01745 [Lachnospiraceae bacterium]|nr:hypothetical protein [Lachnospiraceae bacterium]
MKGKTKVFIKKVMVVIMMAAFISVQISGTQAFARGNRHNHDHEEGHDHSELEEESGYEDLENTTTDVTMDETEKVDEDEHTADNDGVVVEENGPEDELLEEESTEGEVSTEDNENLESELPKIEMGEAEKEPDNESGEALEEPIDDENGTESSEVEANEEESESDSEVVTLSPSVAEQLANLSQEQIDSYMEFAAKREPFFMEKATDKEFYWLARDNGELVKCYYDSDKEELYSNNVTEKFEWLDTVFYVINYFELHMMNALGENDKVIYTSENKIMEVTGTEEYIFFIESDDVYRLHIFSGVCEFICSTAGGNWILPYDNQSFRYVEPTDTMEYDAVDDCYYRKDNLLFYDVLERSNIDFPSDFERVFEKEKYLAGELVIEEESCNDGIMLLSDEDSITYPERVGTADDEINIPGYGISSDPDIKYYFSKTGKACKCHAKCNENVVCECLYFNGSIQCAGYASYAYYLYNGHKKTKYEKREMKNGVHLTAAQWSQVLPGTFMRVNFEEEDTLNRHAIFIYSVEGNFVTYYEANNGGKCLIRKMTKNINDMEADFYLLGYLFNPDYVHTCNYTVCEPAYDAKYPDKYKEKHRYSGCNAVWGCPLTSEENHIESDWYVEGDYHCKKCTECGYVTQKVAHTQSTTYTIDESKHSLECTECGVEMSSGIHNSSNIKDNLNGTHSYSCSVCGKSMSTASHTYGNYISDGSNHWKECTECEVIAGKAAHTPGSLTNIGSIHRKTCTTCGYVTLSANHSYTSSYSKYSSSQHKATCACGAHQYVTHTMTLSGVSASGHTQICSKCGYSVTGSHTFTISKNDTNTHKKVCSFCGYSTTVNHTYVANGYNQYVHFYKCSVCGQSKGVAHEYTSTVTKVSTASTCTRTVKKCSCGYSTTVTDTSHRFTGIRCLDCNYWRG